MTNPYEAPQEDSAPPLTLTEVTRRHGRTGVESADFIRVGLMMQILGGGLLFAGLLLALIHWAVGGVTILLGLLLFVPGRGLAAYKPWAWHAAVLTALPLTVVMAACIVPMSWGLPPGLMLLLFPAMSGWICWVLISRSGRDRYRLLAQSAAKRKQRAKQPVQYEDLVPESLASEPISEPPPAADPFGDLAGG
ncbi:MAG TPA: hypothetical protein VIK18_24950 [Pirellulales bacterium]